MYKKKKKRKSLRKTEREEGSYKESENIIRKLKIKLVKKKKKVVTGSSFCPNS